MVLFPFNRLVQNVCRSSDSRWVAVSTLRLSHMFMARTTLSELEGPRSLCSISRFLTAHPVSMIQADQRHSPWETSPTGSIGPSKQALRSPESSTCTASPTTESAAQQPKTSSSSRNFSGRRDTRVSSLRQLTGMPHFSGWWAPRT
ncbi:hypothetical protein B0T14DRAFT_576939 [Immersiella caudata]|uniref:Uncharacterized protein n=1 Tax=Immersiella caudata TaxID=314043 RepID=A0AA39X2V1_9PEZI|nr:hypothetical protein B0T14DRAFT_576939 [Immersiella caudata]